jgi:predicted RNA-binding Zn-ribbon protein involved in translation (DUF1610 family)
MSLDVKAMKKNPAKEIDFPCYTCGTKMLNKGESANPRYLIIECPACGETFLLLKSKLGKLCSSRK